MISGKIMGITLMLLMLLLGSTQAFDQFYPFEVATGEIKTPAENLGGPWYQDGYGPNFGTGKDVLMSYDETTDDRLEITGPMGFVGSVEFKVNATTTISTVLTAASTSTIYPVDASGGTKVLTLPDAATVAGRVYFIGTSANPGTNSVAVTATGGDKLGGAGGAVYLNTTSDAAGITLISDGTTYQVAGAYGTWA